MMCNRLERDLQIYRFIDLQTLTLYWCTRNRLYIVDVHQPSRIVIVQLWDIFYMYTAYIFTTTSFPSRGLCIRNWESSPE